ncbi:response regulator transcription factor [Luteolibacter sp. SL250]|uniref:response regulator transcription factor n=1 Tax=Luteolibacter sp. SL250 TaxID=2995170 RepID=UPI00226E02DB|nr:response regulator transcription factor [Luteolibacter sp. SL250]WAC21181.1 response regulator transcription factor [Luteolibacter sp. SL250]
MKNPVRLLLADDHAIVIAGLTALLGLEPGFEVVATAEDGEEAVRKYDEHRPDVALIDLRMPGMGGIEAARRIISRHPGARILIISTFESEEDIHRALQAGVGGYLLKGSKRPELVAAIRAVFEGKRWLSAPVARLAAERAKQPELTARQVEVLDLVSKGLSTKEMAVILGLTSEGTKHHLQQIYQKLGVSTRAEATSEALRRGILHPD